MCTLIVAPSLSMSLINVQMLSAESRKQRSVVSTHGKQQRDAAVSTNDFCFRHAEVRSKESNHCC